MQGIQIKWEDVSGLFLATTPYICIFERRKDKMMIEKKESFILFCDCPLRDPQMRRGGHSRKGT